MERMRKYYLAIIRRLLITFFCLSVVPIFGFAWIMKGTVEETNVIKLEKLASITVDHNAQLISAFLREKQELLQLLVSLYEEGAFFDQKQVEKMFLAIGGKSDIVDLLVVDADGDQQSYVGPYRTLVAGKNYFDAAWFRETMLSGIHVSHMFSGYRNVPHFVVAVTDPLKSFVLRATINSSIFNSLLHSAQLGPKSDVFIVNRAGEFQTPSLLQRTELNETEILLLSFDRRNETVITAREVYATRWLINDHWLLILKADIGDSLDFYLQIRNRVILVVALIIALSLAGAIYTSIALARRLEKADKEHAANSLQYAHVEKMATIGRLAAGIAHEINNPLQMITSQAGWIAELLPDEDPAQVKNYDEYRKSVEQIRHHVKRAGTITHRLLGFSRKISTENDRVQINDLVGETLSFVQKEAENNNITIIKNYTADLPPTLTDGPQVQQVLLNLLNNALDAVGPRGVVDIRTSLCAGDRLCIEIGDNGPGIRPEDLKRIFDPFFTTKETDKGTGLGLYISYNIVKKLGGTITVENKQGGGALFTVRLPVVTLGRQG